MPTDEMTGLVEPNITVNGRALSFAESMTVRVALSSFRISLSDAAMRQGIGERLATNYDTHASRVEQLMLLNQPARCDHKFIDSACCVKCGWSPTR
jgi:hypothetical protein